MSSSGSVVPLASAAHAGPADDLSASLQGRSGSASLDRRQEGVLLRVFGQDIKGGCKGDVATAKVHITAASGHLSGDTISFDITGHKWGMSKTAHRTATRIALN